EKAEVIEIPKADFFELFHTDRDVAYKFIQMLANEAVDKEDRLLRLAYAPVRERAAEVLNDLANRFEKPHSGEIELSISREDLAGMVGTATETLIRTLHDFKEEGLITTSGRKIVVLDQDGLKKVSHVM
ncbi:MAG: Crp/Fnr family transcriptional regulator, partial [Flavobacteriales bacterium]|nr:Crp/Fnr family transcriptional regulator [Flavobacteriales bacterium]